MLIDLHSTLFKLLLCILYLLLGRHKNLHSTLFKLLLDRMQALGLKYTIYILLYLNYYNLISSNINKLERIYILLYLNYYFCLQYTYIFI